MNNNRLNKGNNVDKTTFENAIRVHKVDFFKGGQALALTVAGLWKANIAFAELAENTRVALVSCDNAIAGFEKMLADKSKVLTAKEIRARIAEQESRKEEIALQYAKEKADTARFSFSDNEKALAGALKKAACKNDVAAAFVAYFKGYGLDINNTSFLTDLLYRCYKEKTSVKKYVTSAGAATLIIDINGTIKNVISFTFESMVAAKAIKPVIIPEVLRKKYCPTKEEIAERKRKAI